MRRTALFPPEAASVPASRRHVRRALQEAGHEDWLDAAQLAVSEIASNALLHAHTAFEVSVHTSPRDVHVQVWDDDTGRPVRRPSGPEDTTGRGLALVAAVVDGFGVHVVGPSKVVWFSLGTDQPLGGDVLLDRWEGREADSAADQPPEGAGMPVSLLQMPRSLWLSAREHHNTLMREYCLHQQAAHAAPGRVPDALAAADRARSLVLSGVRATPAGASNDLHLSVRPEQGRWFEALRDTLDDAERLAAAGELLASPGPAPVVAVRHWACAQVLGQLSGRPATPWSGPLSLPGGARP